MGKKQTIGYIKIGNKKALVLIRTKKYSRQLKLRESGQDGIRLSDEESYLKGKPSICKKLLDGMVVEI